MERQEHIHGGCCRAWTAQEKQGKAGGEPFVVEELLDFSHEEEDARMASGDDGLCEAARENCSADSSSVTTGDSSTNSFPGGSDNGFTGELVFPSLADAGFSGDLCLPYEELAELEWLSNFVEESFSSEELNDQQLMLGLKSTSSRPTNHSNHHSATATATADKLPSFTFDPPVPVRARSKRARTAPCSWSTRLLLLAPASASSFSDEPAIQLYSVKKQGKKKKLPSSAADGRRCLHCGSDKTPQWRSGPMGPKTLCNACGVRYKSGRLVPEYRPAASPTFELCKHSNSHRKVVEIRRKKELRQQRLQFLSVYPVPLSMVGGEDELVI